MKPLRVALVGAGSMAAKHAAIVAADRSACLTMVVDRDPHRAEVLAEPFGANGETRIEAALDADAVIVATSTPSHREAAMLFIGAGVPVLVEKPLASTLDDVYEMVAAADHGDSVLMCGFVERFNAALGPITRLAADAGCINVVTTRVSPPSPKVHSGVVDDVLLHDLDLVLRLVGGAPLVDVTARADDWGEGAPWPETIRCELTFAGGVTAVMRASRVASTRERTLTATNGSAWSRVDLGRHAGNPLAEQFRHFAHLVRFGSADERSAERRGILPAHELADRIDALIGDATCIR